MDYRDGIIWVLVAVVFFFGVMLHGRKDVSKYHYEIKNVTLEGGRETNFYFFRINNETGVIEVYTLDNDGKREWSLLNEKDNFIYKALHKP